MNEPRGPLSPAVYRRRRVFALGGTVVAVLLFIWAVGALLGGNDSTTVRGASDERPVGVPLAGPASGSQRASNPPPTGQLALGSAASSATHPSTTSAAPAAGPPASPQAPPPPPPPPPGPPQPCADAALAVTATVAHPSAPAGSRIVLTLHVANTGPVACTRDLSRQLRDVQVVPAAGGAPLWSSGDCYTVNSHEVRTLPPGHEVAYTVTWSGRTSAPGCPAGRATVPAGRYAVVGRLGPIVSAPTPLTLT